MERLLQLSSGKKGAVMRLRIVVLFCMVALCLASISCQKLAQPGEFKFEKVPFLNAIPAEYGTLMAVTPNVGDPNWAHLWFEKPDKTITVVNVDVARGDIYQRVLVIPRR
jgi:hypothetical protein